MGPRFANGVSAGGSPVAQRAGGAGHEGDAGVAQRTHRLSRRRRACHEPGGGSAPTPRWRTPPAWRRIWRRLAARAQALATMVQICKRGARRRYAFHAWRPNGCSKTVTPATQRHDRHSIISTTSSQAFYRTPGPIASGAAYPAPASPPTPAAAAGRGATPDNAPSGHRTAARRMQRNAHLRACALTANANGAPVNSASERRAPASFPAFRCSAPAAARPSPAAPLRPAAAD